MNRAAIKQWTRYLWRGFAALGFVLGLAPALFVFAGGTDRVAYLHELLLWSVSIPIALWIANLNGLFGWWCSAIVLCALLAAALVFAPAANPSASVGLGIGFLFAIALALVAALRVFHRRAWLFDLFAQLLHAIRRALWVKNGKGFAGLMLGESHKKYLAVYLLQVFAVFFFAGSVLGTFVGLILMPVSVISGSNIYSAEDFIHAMKLMAAPWHWWESADVDTGMFECADVMIASIHECLAFRLKEDLDISRRFWSYMLAAQTCYILLPRLVILIYARIGLFFAAGEKAPLVRSIPSPYLLIVWDSAPDFARQFIEKTWSAARESIEKTEIDALIKRQKRAALRGSRAKASRKGRISAWRKRLAGQLAERRAERLARKAAMSGSAHADAERMNWAGKLAPAWRKLTSFIRDADGGDPEKSSPFGDLKSRVTAAWRKLFPPLAEADGGDDSNGALESLPDNLVVLVKSSSLPSWDLHEGMQRLPHFPNRMVLPLDWNEREMQPVARADLQEWRRAARTLAPGDWAVLGEPK